MALDGPSSTSPVWPPFWPRCVWADRDAAVFLNICTGCGQQFTDLVMHGFHISELCSPCKSQIQRIKAGRKV